MNIDIFAGVILLIAGFILVLLIVKGGSDGEKGGGK